jgi:hypothetical protein
MINPISKDAHLEPVERAAQNPLVLGLFLPLQSGAWSPSTALDVMDVRLQCALHRLG